MTDSESNPPSAAGKVPVAQALAYGAGNVAGNFLGWGMGGLYTVFNLVLGVSPALVGLAQSLPRFVDVFTDPLAGYLSDSLRRKYDRRFFVAAGSIFGGLSVASLWLFPRGLSSSGYFVWILAFASAAMIGWSFLSVPLQALGFEMTGNANERTKLMAVSTFMTSAAGLGSNWNYVVAQSALFRNTISGVRSVGCLMAFLIVVFGLTSACCCKGRSAGAAAAIAPAGHARVPAFGDFLAASRRVMRNRPFVLLTFSIIAMLIGLFGAGMCGTYIYIYYLAAGSQVKGMIFSAVGLTAYQTASILSTAPVLWLSRRLGKKKALLSFLGVGLAGHLLKWICFNPAWPWLLVVPMATSGVGFAALWVLTSSMMADISDCDEAASGNQDAGMFSAFYLWTTKFATSLAIAIGGVMLTLTGFNVALGQNQGHGTILRMRIFDYTFPAVCTLIAIVLMSRYPITAAQMDEVQNLLKRQSRAPAAP